MSNDTEQQCILLDRRDNTATALSDLDPGVTVRLAAGEAGEECEAGKECEAGEEGGRAATAEAAVEEIVIRDRIPYAHKFARRPISSGEDVRKYGQVIGVATADIEAGDHVHVHNIRGKRA